jgi:hypothetical protein
MQVGNEKERLVSWLLGKFDRRHDCTEDIAEMRSATALYACKNSCHSAKKIK